MSDSNKRINTTPRKVRYTMQIIVGDMMPTRTLCPCTTRRMLCIRWTISACGIVGKRSINPDLDSSLRFQAGNRFGNLIVICTFAGISKMNFLLFFLKTDETGICKIARAK